MESTNGERMAGQDTAGGMDAAGIVRELGELGPGAVLTEEGLAALFGKHRDSVRRAVERGELPRPVKLFGQRGWTAGAIVRHIEKRLEAAQKDAERMAAQEARLSV